MGYSAQLTPPGKSTYDCSNSGSYMSTVMMTYIPSKLGRTDQVLFVCDQSSSVFLCMQEYKSLRAAVMILCHPG